MARTHHTHHTRHIQGTRARRSGTGLVWAGIITCPCHWPLILLVVLSGTAAGTTLEANFVALFAASAAFSAAAIGAGYLLLRRKQTQTLSCPTCARGDDGETRGTADAQLRELETHDRQSRGAYGDETDPGQRRRAQAGRR